MLISSYILKNDLIFNFLLSSSDTNLFQMVDKANESILMKAVLRSDVSTVEKLFSHKKDAIKID